MGSAEPSICSGVVNAFSDRVKLSQISVRASADTPFITLQKQESRLYAQNHTLDLMEFIQDPIARDKALLKLPSREGPILLDFHLEVTQPNCKILALVQCPTAFEAAKLLTKIEPKSDKIYDHRDIFIVDTLPINVASEFKWTWRWNHLRDHEPDSKGTRANFMFVIFDVNTNTCEEQFHFDLWMENSSAFSDSTSFQLKRTDSSESNYSSRTHVSSYTGDANFEHPRLDRLSPLVSKLANFQWDLKTSPSEEINEPVLEKELPQPSLADNLGKAEDTAATPISLKKHQAEPFNIDIVDSPLLRYKIQQSEKKVTALKYEIKKLLKAIAAYDEVYQQQIRVGNNLLGTIKEVKSLEPILKFIDPVFFQISRDREILQKQMRTLIFYPLKRIYENDIKTVDYRTKEFMREAEEFYHAEAKHLSVKNDRDKSSKQLSSDRKYEIKRNLFEQKILDFYSFLHELTEGPKEDELMSCFTSFGQKCFEHVRKANRIANEYESELNEVISHLNNQATAVNTQRMLMEEKKMHIGKSISDPGASAHYDPSNRSENSRNFVSLVRSKSSALRDKLTNRTEGTHDLEVFNAEQALSAGRHKEGVLYSPNRHRTPNLESSWQSNWCVISKGQFSEIINWKKKPDAYKASISLKIASVRQIPDAERRFCFELVTLQGRRLYQALSYEDMVDWINVLKNAIESQLNGTGSSPDLRSLAVPSGEATSRRKSEDLSHEYKESSLISVFRAHSSNHYCADCGSRGPEWCSINLGVLLCIECSGVHRSLGTHISKIRSLTLDNSFTPDLVEMVKRIGNQTANSIWEAALSQNTENTQSRVKPINSDSRDFKAAFIKAKYVDRKFLDYSIILSHDLEPLKTASTSRLSQPDSNPFKVQATELLFKAIESNDIHNVIRAFALGADLNYRKFGDNPEAAMKMTYAAFLETPIDDEGVTPLQVALSMPSNSHAVAKPSLGPLPSHYEQPITEMTPADRDVGDSGDRFTTFPIAEFLIQNGADINQSAPQSGFTLLHIATIEGAIQAVKYLLSKGSNPRTVDHYGKTAYVWSILTGDLCGKVLRDALASIHQPTVNVTSTATTSTTLNNGAISEHPIYDNSPLARYSIRADNLPLNEHTIVSPSSKLETMGVAQLFK